MSILNRFLDKIAELCNIIIMLLKKRGVWMQDLSIAFLISEKFLFSYIYNRILGTAFVFCAVVLVHAVYLCFRNSICIQGKNYIIKIEYGNLFEMHSCKRVISFDECFTTTVGSAPSDINPDSICGQYLEKNQIGDEQMKKLIASAGLKSSGNRSEYQGKVRYDSGTLVPNGEYLLMAFAKLDKDGLGKISREEFIDCLELLWKEIDKYYGQKDVCIPILGSGVTRWESNPPTQQELLDIMIWSYQLSVHKIKTPSRLHIICRRSKGFSLNNVCGAI